MNAGVKQVRDTPALQSIRQEFLFCLKHVSKRRYGLVFVSCQDVNCKCPGELADWNCSFMTELGSLGGTLPTPTPSAEPNRYKTLKDHFESSERPFADQHCPSRISKNLGWCERCPSYVFTSVTNANHHQSLVHGNVSCAQPHFKLGLPTFNCTDAKLRLGVRGKRLGIRPARNTKSRKQAPSVVLKHRVKGGRFMATETASWRSAQSSCREG